MSRASQRGVILVTVLWTVILLSILAIATSLTFRGFTGIMAIDQKRLKADGLLTAGLEVAAGLVSSAGEIQLLDVESTVTLASGVAHIRLDDEGGRIDIGKAPVEVLVSLFRSVGAADPDGLARALIEWRKIDTAPAAAATSGTAAAKPTAADSRITDVADLLQVPGMRPEWVSAVAPLVTVFGNDTVNPLTAPAPVLAALPGMDPARVATFLNARAQPGDPKQQLALLGSAQGFIDVKPPRAVAVALTAELGTVTPPAPPP